MVSPALRLSRQGAGIAQGFASVLDRLRPYLSTAALALLIFYFGYHALTGEGGLLRSNQRDATLLARKAELAKLSVQRHDLELRAQLLRDESLSADLLEERARDLLGFADPRDYVIRMRP
jgi:cell division protein FtsB